MCTFEGEFFISKNSKNATSGKLLVTQSGFDWWKQINKINDMKVIELTTCL